MKRLIYLSSLGHPGYRRMTEMCIRSLRGPGGYGDEILVFSNNGYEAQDPGIHVAGAPSGLDWFGMCAFKAEAGLSIAGDDYDQVAWMDCDMIAVDDVTALFEESEDSVRGMEEEPWTRMTDPAGGDCLNDEERERAASRWGINTGFLCVPGRLLAECMGLWRREMEIRRPVLTNWPDQTPFNALVLNGKFPFRAYPRGWIDMPPMYFWRGGRLRVTEATRILHFCWPRKDHAIEEMSVFLSELEGEQEQPHRTPRHLSGQVSNLAPALSASLGGKTDPAEIQ